MAQEFPDDLLKKYERTVLSAVDAQARGRHELALELFSDGLELARQTERPRLEQIAQLNLSEAYLCLGEHAAARTGLAAIVLESDDPQLISQAAGRLARAYMKEGRLERAGSYLATGLTRARECGDSWQEGWCLLLDGDLHVLLGEHDEAVESYQLALSIRNETHAEADTAGLASILDNLGYALLLAQRVPEGLGILRRALNQARTDDNVRLQAESEKDMAFAFLLAKKPKAAERHALHALKLAKLAEDFAILRSAYYLLMEASLRLNRDQDFERYFLQLQESMPETQLSRDFFRIFDITDVICLKEF